MSRWTLLLLATVFLLLGQHSYGQIVFTGIRKDRITTHYPPILFKESCKSDWQDKGDSLVIIGRCPDNEVSILLIFKNDTCIKQVMKYVCSNCYESNLKQILKDNFLRWKCIGKNEYISEYRYNTRMTLEKFPNQTTCIIVTYKQDNWSEDEYDSLSSTYYKWNKRGEKYMYEKSYISKGGKNWDFGKTKTIKTKMLNDSIIELNKENLSLKQTVNKYLSVNYNYGLGQNEYNKRVKQFIDPNANVDSLITDRYYNGKKDTIWTVAYPKIKNIVYESPDHATVFISYYLERYYADRTYKQIKTDWVRKDNKWFRTAKPGEYVNDKKE